MVLRTGGFVLFRTADLDLPALRPIFILRGPPRMLANLAMLRSIV